MFSTKQPKEDAEMRVIDILQGVQPSLGCTEPAAIALAAALARQAVGGEVKRVAVSCDANVFKNALSAGIPGPGKLKGLLIAAGLGAIAGDPQLRLEVLSKVTPEDVRIVEGLLEAGFVTVELKEGPRRLYIEAIVETDQGTGRAVIEDRHTNVTAVEANGQHLPLPNWVELGAVREESEGRDAALARMTLREVLALVEEMTAEEIEYMLEGVRMNEAASRAGLTTRAGLGIGPSLADMIEEGLLADDLASRAEVLAASAVDARMSGMRVPVMTSSHSGNQGITAIMPVVTVARELNVGDEELAKAVATSHLITAYIKAHLGNLSAMCAAYMAAGIGAAAGIVRLLGGEEEEIGRAISIMVGNVAGVICDGAKTGCALKVGTAASLAVKCALLAMRGAQVPGSDGIVDETPERTVRNLGLVGDPGMVETDAQILRIMLEKGK